MMYFIQNIDELQEILKKKSLTNSQRKWLTEIARTGYMNSEHRIHTLRLFGFDPIVLDEFEPYYLDRVYNKDEAYRRCRSIIEKRINNFLYSIRSIFYFKVDYKKRELTVGNIKCYWDDSKIYIEGKMIAFIKSSNATLFRIFRRLNNEV